MRKLEDIVKLVSEITGISNEDIFSKVRKWEVVRARFLIYHIADLEGYKKMWIGKFFGYDHSSIIHGIQKVRDEIKIYNNVRLIAQQLEETIVKEQDAA